MEDLETDAVQEPPEGRANATGSKRSGSTRRGGGRPSAANSMDSPRPLDESNNSRLRQRPDSTRTTTTQRSTPSDTEESTPSDTEESTPSETEESTQSDSEIEAVPPTTTTTRPTSYKSGRRANLARANDRRRVGRASQRARH
jgi:cell division protein FtsN